MLDHEAPSVDGFLRSTKSLPISPVMKSQAMLAAPRSLCCHTFSSVASMANRLGLVDTTKNCEEGERPKSL
jgi:hypothetical protein